MNNLLSYHGLTDARMSASEKDLPVIFIILPYSKYFLILASSGEYVPVMVDHSDDLPCRGVYFLHHGLQRRIRITIGNLF